MMPLLLALAGNTLWYLLPLSLGISLVYSASRYELTSRIIRRATRLFVTIVGFMTVVLVVLFVLQVNL